MSIIAVKIDGAVIIYWSTWKVIEDCKKNQSPRKSYLLFNYKYLINAFIPWLFVIKVACPLMYIPI